MLFVVVIFVVVVDVIVVVVAVVVVGVVVGVVLIGVVVVVVVVVKTPVGPPHGWHHVILQLRYLGVLFLQGLLRLFLLDLQRLALAMPGLG